MSKTNPFPARLTETQQNGLQRVADACSVKKTDVLGWAVDALISYFDAKEGTLTIPLKFDREQTLSQIINNSIEQKGKAHKARQKNK